MASKKIKLEVNNYPNSNVISNEHVEFKEIKVVSSTKPGETKLKSVTTVSSLPTSTGISTLSDASLQKYKKQIDELTKQINSWEKALSEAETYLNNSVGATFKANYSLGATAGKNIQKIIDILQGCKNDLKKLTTAGNEYYKKLQSVGKK